MVRVLIADDEELARRGIKARLLRAGDAQVVAECSRGAQAIEAIRRTTPELVFLDVQMPGKTGFEVIEAIGVEQFPHVIFVTAHDCYALRAFDVHALDYVLKPIDDDRFDLALERARQCLSLSRDGDLGRRLASALGDLRASAPSEVFQNQAKRLVVKSGSKITLLRISEIDWIEAAGDYLTIHVAQKSWLMRGTMSAMEGQLANRGFARIHRSALVNLDRVREMKAVDNSDYMVLLSDGTVLKLSRKYRSFLNRWLPSSAGNRPLIV
jgi:two-component system LytT family response regulator